jgi:hypothetical protein
MREQEQQIKISATFWKGFVRGRILMLEWMAECCEDFSWTATTRYIAISILDRYLTEKKAVPIDELQLIAGACLSLASKSEVC